MSFIHFPRSFDNKIFKRGVPVKKIILSIMAFSFMMVIGCGKTDKISEAKAVLNGMNSGYETLMGGISKAGSADDVAAALDKFSNDMGPLAVKAKELEKKYPEIRFSDLKNPPKELEADFKKLDGMNKKFMTPAVMNKIEKYAKDPKVTKALTTMVEKLSIK
jgi:hypothetical protein